MQSNRPQISLDEIQAYFYREHLLPASLERREKGRDLTASAKFIAREAKKLLGRHASSQDISKISEHDLLTLVQVVEEAQGEELTDSERTAALALLSAGLEHYDILTPLVENPEVNDIIIRSYDDISIQTGRVNIQTDLHFSDPATYKSFIENLLKRAGKSCTVATPVIDAAIDPHIRACVTHESFSPPGSGPMLTLRISRHPQITTQSLIQYQLAPKEIFDYLGAVVHSGRGTLLIAGEVGTGKTTLVKALTSHIPEDQAILVIEDTNEIVLHRKFVRTLLTREANTEGAGRISPGLAIRTGMRMAMNRLILGEMRDAEAAEAFIDVCASGHAGMSTIHAKSARDALGRLELFLARIQGNISIDTIRRQIANAVSVVVYLGVDRNHGKRRILEVAEVGNYADGVVQFSPLFKYLPVQGFPEWQREVGISEFQDELRNQGYPNLSTGCRLHFHSTDIYRSRSHASTALPEF